jgi:hypothetical protein
MHRLVTGRPPTSAELTALIERLATENNGWGVQELCRTLHNQRIQGELTSAAGRDSTAARVLATGLAWRAAQFVSQARAALGQRGADIPG